MVIPVVPPWVFEAMLIEERLDAMLVDELTDPAVTVLEMIFRVETLAKEASMVAMASLDAVVLSSKKWMSYETTPFLMPVTVAEAPSGKRPCDVRVVVNALSK